MDHSIAFPDVRAILAASAWQAKQSLGQNFLRSAETCLRIADSLVPQADDMLLEIGGGLGSLTWALLQRAQDVRVVEIDRRMQEHLQSYFGTTTLRLYPQDVRNLHLDEIPEKQGQALLYGNLPYNLTTELCTQILLEAAPYRAAVILIQKEAGLRLFAAPGNKAYGPVAVLAALLAKVERLFDVPAEAFWPRPTVRSAVFRLQFQAFPGLPGRAERAAFWRFLQLCFGHRRKQLGAILNRSEGLFETQLLHVASAQGLAERRAETLSPDALWGLYAAARELDEAAALGYNRKEDGE